MADGAFAPLGAVGQGEVVQAVDGSKVSSTFRGTNRPMWGSHAGEAVDVPALGLRPSQRGPRLSDDSSTHHASCCRLGQADRARRDRDLVTIRLDGLVHRRGRNVREGRGRVDDDLNNVLVPLQALVRVGKVGRIVCQEHVSVSLVAITTSERRSPEPGRGRTARAPEVGLTMNRNVDCTYRSLSNEPA